MRLFEPDLLGVCWECGDALGDELIVPSSQAGYWAHVQCDLEAAIEADADASRSVTGGQMEGPYSARLASAAGETSRQAQAAGHGSRRGTRHVTTAAAVERPPPG